MGSEVYNQNCAEYSLKHSAFFILYVVLIIITTNKIFSLKKIYLLVFAMS
jgi:hypothetical protein